jgi:hypothetical protein
MQRRNQMVNFVELERVCEATALLPAGDFNMANVCGSACCMIGNYNAMVGRQTGTFGRFTQDWQHFSISHREYFWLFGTSGGGRRLATDWARLFADLDDVDRLQAIARLRKFIAYKRRKYELIHDDKFGVSLRSRTMEGNHNFAMLAKSEATAV